MFVSALDRPHGDDTTAHGLRDDRAANAVRFLRHVHDVEITGQARNWDAQRCFVLLVNVKDTEVPTAASQQAGLQVVRPDAPFQIERTRKAFRKLTRALHKWSQMHGPRGVPSCAFCAQFQEPEQERGLVALFSGGATRAWKEEQWQRWLNDCIHHVRGETLTEAAPCQGMQHIPSVLARFLLQEFASDVIF